MYLLMEATTMDQEVMITDSDNLDNECPNVDHSKLVSGELMVQKIAPVVLTLIRHLAHAKSKEDAESTVLVVE